MTQGLSLSSPTCLSPYTVVCFFFPPNKHYLFHYFLSENPFLQSQRARALSLIIGLVARIWCFPNLWLEIQTLLYHCRPKPEAQFSSIQLLSRVNSLRLHGLQHTRLSCLSPTPGACLNLCPLSRWCRPTSISSVTHFSSCLQSFPASGSGKEMFPSSFT